MNFAVAGASSEGLEPASEPTGRGRRRGRGRGFGGGHANDFFREVSWARGHANAK